MIDSRSRTMRICPAEAEEILSVFLDPQREPLTKKSETLVKRIFDQFPHLREKWERKGDTIEGYPERSP